MHSDNADSPAPPSDRERLKQAAAVRPAAQVADGMAVGLGTGSTATYVIAELIRRSRDEGLRFVGLPTSDRSGHQALEGGLVLTDFAANASLDMTIDGADQVQRGRLSLIKGLGGALLREKIVAAASARLVIVVDDAKLADHLSLPVPVEVDRFGWEATRRRIEALGATTRLRSAPDGSPFITDGGHLILDCDFGTLDDAAPVDRALHDIVGLIETGYFIGRAAEVLVAGAGGVERLLPVIPTQA